MGWVKPPFSGLSESSGKGKGSDMWFWLLQSNFTLGASHFLLCLFSFRCTWLADGVCAALGAALPSQTGMSLSDSQLH